MNRDIVIVREDGAYRLLHGHLRLANLLKADGEAWVALAGDERVKIIQPPDGYLVACGAQHLTLLRCFNRMNDLVDNCRVDGEILVDGKNVYDRSVNVAELRRRVSMVFQKPNPFPKSASC